MSPDDEAPAPVSKAPDARPGRAARRPRSRLVPWIARIVMLLLSLEFASRVTIAVANQRLPEPVRKRKELYANQSEAIRKYIAEDPAIIQRLDPDLGWRYRPGFTNATDQINAAGLRGRHEYDKHPAAGVLRVGTFGDSFVYGSEVSVDEAWPTLIDREEDPRRIEVLNYGVPGYGTDQAYLRYLRDGTEYAPDVVIMGFPPTDLARTVSIYRRFYHSSEPPVFKPRYVLDGSGKLTLLATPIRSQQDYEKLLQSPADVLRFGPDDHWYEPLVYETPLHDSIATLRLACFLGVRARRRYLGSDRPMVDEHFNTQSTAFAIQSRLFEMFLASATERHTQGLVVMLPDRASIVERRAGRTTSYDAMTRALADKGLSHLDAVDAFLQVEGSPPLDGWFAPGEHYSPAGNRIVATWLARELRRRFPPPSRSPL